MGLTQEVYKVLNERFSLSEVKTILFDMGYSHETISSNYNTKTMFVMDVVNFAQRRGLFPQLVQSMVSNRADLFNWAKGLNFDVQEPKPVYVVDDTHNGDTTLRTQIMSHLAHIEAHVASIKELMEML